MEGFLCHDVVEIFSTDLSAVRGSTLKHFLELLNVHCLAELLSHAADVVGVNQSSVIIVEQVEDLIDAILNEGKFTLDSLSPNLEVMPSKNSSKSTSRPRLSRSAIMLKMVGFLLSNPRLCMADLSSLGSILPVASVSKRLKASLSSSISSSVSPGLSIFFLAGPLAPGLGLQAIEQILIKYNPLIHFFGQINTAGANSKKLQFLLQYGRILVSDNKLVSYSCLYNIMNFDSQTPIDALIGRLLAFIIMFQKKIEQLKCKLAGNQQFHTRLAFQALDLNRKNQISHQILANILRSVSLTENDSNCELFLRRYSKNGALTYDQFLKLITPKGNSILAQRMLVRSYSRGAVLEDYLYRHLLELLSLYVKMTSITESLRNAIQQNEDLSHLDIIEFFHQRIVNPSSLISFLERSTEQGQQYDIDFEDAFYLSFHIKSGNDIEYLTDIDIKELLCSLDMNFQKPVPLQTFYRQTNYSAKEPQFNQTKTVDFLGKTYQKMFDKPKQSLVKRNGPDPSYIHSDKYTNRFPSNVERSSLQDQSYGNLYIDNFARSETGNSRLQINDFIGNKIFNKRQVEVFQDQLGSNNSSISRHSKESAFDRS